jgi:hypothetical protein
MTPIYSKIHPEKLLHLIVRKDAFKEGRIDLCPADQFLQCAALRMNHGKTFRPHQHIWHRINDDRVAQESWAVIKGTVKVFLYDLDGTLIHTDIIQAGEASFTFLAGHTYEILEDDTRVLEYKTGPYLGQEHDKTFID